MLNKWQTSVPILQMALCLLADQGLCTEEGGKAGERGVSWGYWQEEKMLLSRSHSHFVFHVMVTMRNKKQESVRALRRQAQPMIEGAGCNQNNFRRFVLPSDDCSPGHTSSYPKCPEERNLLSRLASSHQHSVSTHSCASEIFPCWGD